MSATQMCISLSSRSARFVLRSSVRFIGGSWAVPIGPLTTLSAATVANAQRGEITVGLIFLAPQLPLTPTLLFGSVAGEVGPRNGSSDIRFRHPYPQTAQFFPSSS